MKKIFGTLCALACAVAVFAQTQIDLRTQGKDVDFSGAAATKPVQTGSGLPSTCSVGQLFFLTTAPAGSNLNACVSANTWAPINSGGGSGGAVSSVAGKTGNVILQATDLADCRLVLSSPTVLSFNNCAFSYPDLGQQTVPAGTITNLGGSGTAYIYAAPAGTINVLHSGILSIACTGCTDAGAGNAFPADVAPLGVWGSTTTPGNWDASAVSDQRTLITGPPQIGANTGVAITINSLGQKVIGIDPAMVETKSAEQAGQEVLCVGSGSASTQTCSLLPVLTAYTTGMRIRFLSGATNVGPLTLNINNLGPVSVLQYDGATALAAGNVTAGIYYDLTYDGTVFRLPAGSAGTGSGSSGSSQSGPSSFGTLILAADQTVSSTALTDINNIMYSLAASTSYVFHCKFTGSYTSASGQVLTPVYTGTTSGVAYSYLAFNEAGIFQGGGHWTDLTGHPTSDNRGNNIPQYLFDGNFTTTSAGIFKFQSALFFAGGGSETISARSYCQLTTF